MMAGGSSEDRSHKGLTVEVGETPEKLATCDLYMGDRDLLVVELVMT